MAVRQADLARENERLRFENRVLKEERDILKRLPSSSRAGGREVCVHAQLAPSMTGGDIVPYDAGRYGRDWILNNELS